MRDAASCRTVAFAAAFVDEVESARSAIILTRKLERKKHTDLSALWPKNYWQG